MLGILSDMLILIGFVLIGYACFLVDRIAGFTFAGIVCLVLSFLLAKAHHEQEDKRK